MKTTTNVHTPDERLAVRRLGERRTLQSQWRLMLCVSILRTAVTEILPLAGAAGWWVALVCLVPALLLYALGCLGLRITRTATLTDCLRQLMGRAGVWLLHLLVTAALVWEGIASMTVLITLFTQGIGAQGTQLTMALVAAGMLLFCLNKEGLSRGIFLLRWTLLLMLLGVLAGLAGMAKVDHLFPWRADGAIPAALLRGVGMGWPLVLALMQPPVKKGRLAAPCLPVGLCILCLLLLTLALPHELLLSRPALADSMMLTVAFQGSFLRLVALCLWMVALFFSIGSSVSLGAQMLLAPTGRELVWLPGMLLLGIVITQTGDIHSLWRVLGGAEAWLLLPLGAGAVLSILVRRRKKA